MLFGITTMLKRSFSPMVLIITVDLILAVKILFPILFKNVEHSLCSYP